MAWFAATKDLRERRESGDRHRRAGRIEDAVREYRALMHALAEAGLRLRATAMCRTVLELSPGDDDASLLLAELTGRGRDPKNDVTLEVQLGDVLAEMPDTPPPLPGDHHDDDLRRRIAHGCRLFAGLPHVVGDAIIGALDAQVFPAGSPLMRAWRTSPGLFAIATGEIEVMGSDAPGGVPRCIVGGGHVVGEMSALPENLASGDVVTRTSITGLFLSTTQLAGMAERFPPLRERLDKLSICRRALNSRMRPDSPTPLG